MTLFSDFPVTAPASGSFFKWLGRFFAIHEFDPLSATERRTRLRDLMDSHPEAFDSEISVQGLMSLYPHSFEDFAARFFFGISAPIFQRYAPRPAATAAAARKPEALPAISATAVICPAKT